MPSHATFQPLLGLTIGDPAGIGPEILAKAVTQEEVRAACRPLIIGEAEIMRRAIRLCRLDLHVHPIASPTEMAASPGCLEVLDLKNIDTASCPPGVLAAHCGRAAVEYLNKAIDLAIARELDGVVTGPLNKEAMAQAGFRYDGQTELFAERTGVKDYAMLLAVGRMRVLHVSTHTSLRTACDKVKRARILTVIRLAHQVLRDLGSRQRRIGVAGLNPHAGENGRFGREEIEEIAPAVEAARAEGIGASGPYPPDTLFHRHRLGEFDALVAMYHDQGHIPLKLIGFHRGVNVTVGLPIIRTSVDHGTAFDIAGTGTANPRSLVEAILLATKFAHRRRKASHPLAV
ncbi:MAG: 4-hydroxythreonine-4-phosphate dehydrogenase PdxA [Candidatus Methylomirabilota bacterium]|nr:MAG: 4-hydroxythreonine-4-phosphate dehydrogenase PdxA [candidate division NC10 bacterium]